MRLQKQHYRFFTVAAACFAFASLASMQVQAQSDGVGGKAELAAQSDTNPHEWGLTTPVLARTPAVSSEKNPHEWGLPVSVLATAPAAQSDKNPHEWGLRPEGLTKAQVVRPDGNQ